MDDNSKLESSESLDSDLESPKSNNISSTDPTSKTKEIKCNGVNDAEDGECSDSENKKLEGNEKKVEEVAEELEEGEISNDDDTSIPETFGSRNVCKFFLRGRCSWGPECRFLHCVLTDNGEYIKALEPVTSVVCHLVNSAQVSNAWEHTLIMAKSALMHSDKYKKKLQEESDHESKKIPSAEIRFTRYPQTRHYSPVVNTKRQDEHSRIRPRESCRSYSKHEDQDLYKSRRPKREVSIPREKEAWTDSWMRSNSAAGPKRRRRRNYSSSNSSTSDSSSDSSSTSQGSHRSHKRYSRRNWENERSLYRKEIKGQSRSDKFRRSRKQNTSNREKARTHKETKRSIRSSSSSSDSDRSVLKSRSRNKGIRSDVNLVTKYRERNSSSPTASKNAHSDKKNSEKRKFLLKKLKNIEKAIAKYGKH